MSWSTIAIVGGIALIAANYFWPQIKTWLETASPMPLVIPTSQAEWSLSTVTALLKLQDCLRARQLNDEANKVGEIVGPKIFWNSGPQA